MKISSRATSGRNINIIKMLLVEANYDRLMETNQYFPTIFILVLVLVLVGVQVY